MKKALYIAALGLLFGLCSYTLFGRSVNASATISKAISEGQTETISDYFAHDMELYLGGRGNHCSKEQAVHVLNEFFKVNKPEEYICHSNRNYITGKLKTANGKTYTVDYTLKSLPNQELITGMYVY